MFGILAADLGQLTEEQLLRYRACYCGLCRCLKERHGQLSRLTLNYDMSFLILLLGSLYEPEERAGEDRCLLHPRRQRAWFISEATEYAADMNLALSYYKCRDDWEDDGSLSALAASGLLKEKFAQVSQRWPRQCAAMADAMERLARLEKDRQEDPDAAAAAFGELMAEALVWREDRWSGTLRAMGRALGGFIYVMDACLDLDRDAAFNRYNPFRRYYGLGDNEGRFRDMLRMLLGECLFHFDRLPLVQDAQLLQHILCAGVWTGFDKKFSGNRGEKEDSFHDSGPV